MNQEFIFLTNKADAAVQGAHFENLEDTRGQGVAYTMMTCSSQASCVHSPDHLSDTCKVDLNRFIEVLNITNSLVSSIQLNDFS